MTKRLSLAVFVLLAASATVGCTGGRYLGPKPFPGPLGDVVAGNLGLTCPGDIFVGPPVNRCLRSIGGNASRYSASPIDQGGIGGRQLSSTDKMALFCGLAGSGTAMVLKAGLERIIGAGLISIAACEVAGTLLNNRRGRNGDVVVTPPPSNRGSMRQGGSGSASGGTAPFWGFGPSARPNCMEQGMFTLDNQGLGPLRVFKDGQPFEVLKPKEQLCAPLDGNYTGEIMAMVVGRDGLTGKVGVAPAKPESKPGLVLVWR